MKTAVKRATAVLLALSMVQLAAVQAVADGGPAKDEVIYINLKADGQLDEMNVVNVFDLDQEGQVVDHGNYSQVKNLTTTQQILQQGEEITFTAPQGRFYYQGKLEQGEIPWEIRVTYRLDGREISGEELAGKSGHLEIEVEIAKNPNANPVYAENFALQATVLLDGERCQEIASPQATIASVGEDKQLSYIILPGKEERLEITAEVTDFEMGGIQINGIPLNLSIDDPDTAEIKDKIAQLQDGAKELDDGAVELNDGAKELDDGAVELNDGAKELDDGAADLYDGAKELDSGAADLQDGAAKLDDGVSDLQDGVGTLRDGAHQLDSGVTDLVDGASQTAQGARQLYDGTGELKQGTDSLQQGAQGLRDGAVTLAQGSQVIQNGLDQLLGKSDELRKGADAVGQGFQRFEEILGGIPVAMEAEGQPSLQEEAAALREELDSLIGELEGQLQDLLEEQERQEQEDSPEEDEQELTIGSSDCADDRTEEEREAAYYRRQETRDDGVSRQISLLKRTIGSLEGLRDSCAGLEQQAQAAGAAGGLLGQLVQGFWELDQGYRQLEDGIQGYTEGVERLGSGYGELYQGIQKLDGGTQQLLEGANTLKQGADELYAGSGQLRDGTQQLYDGTVTLKDGSGQLAEGSDELDQGARDLKDGTQELRDGTVELKDGTRELRDGTVELKDGTRELWDGTVELKDGTGELREQSDTMDTQVDDEINRMLEEYRGKKFEMVSFVSPENREVDSVQFVMKTADISKEEEPEPVQQEQEAPSFWERLKNLFLGWFD